MPSDFSVSYFERSDDDLLLLASDRASLTTEAGLALDAELRRRNLTESDRVKYQQFIKHDERRGVKLREMLRILKFAGFVVIHFVIAVIGTAILDTSLRRRLVTSPHSFSAIIWTECVLSIVC